MEKGKNLVRNIKKAIFEHKVISLVLLMFFLLGAITIVVSYAFYETIDFQSIIGGNVKEIPELDVRIYVESRDASGLGNGTYGIASYIPQAGYVYNGSKSYCTNGSTITYDEVNFETLVDAVGYDLCYVYFDAKDNLDLTMNVYVEDVNVEGVGLGTYSLYVNESLPQAGFALNSSKSSCVNGSEISYSTKDSLVIIEALNKDTCDVYMDALEVDILVDIFAQSAVGSTEYVQIEEIPHNVYYSLNNRSTCTNSATLALENQQITIQTGTKTSCDVYLDIASGPILESLKTTFNNSVLDINITSYIGGNSVATYYYSIDGGITFNSTTAQLVSVPITDEVEVVVYGVDATGNKSSLLKTTSHNGYVYKGIFGYNSNVQTLNITQAGYYDLHVWGAQGGSFNADYARGGNGGYSTGKVYLNVGDILYIHTGGQGNAYSSTTFDSKGGGGTNGGGNAGYRGGGGGGASDIRVNEDSLYARLIVAGGGGGAYAYDEFNAADGGDAGGLLGLNGSYVQKEYRDMIGNFGKQTEGGVGGLSTPNYHGEDGAFGIGGSTGYKYNNSAYYSSGAGGGGWYGGGAAANYNGEDVTRGAGGGGGSGYVYTVATQSKYPSGCLLNSSYYLQNATSYGGNKTFISPMNISEKGHSGNGYILINYIGAYI
ncbi:MAG: hypothetical protein E7172_03975 [Firmicutes bacterium]|nr:hypothetical protein [Bacillota bacterium]